MTHLNYSLTKLGKTFKKQKSLSKSEKDLIEIYADCCRERKHEWMDYVKANRCCINFFFKVEI